MPRSSRWEKRVLYAVLVGRLDRTGRQVSSEVIADRLLELYGSLRDSLSGLSYLKASRAGIPSKYWSTVRSARTTASQPGRPLSRHPGRSSPR